MVLVILVAGTTWAGENSMDQLSPRWASSFSGQDWQTGPKPAATTPYQANLTPTFYTAPITPANVRDLALESDRPRTQGILASTAWLKGALTTETEVAANQGGAIGPHDGMSGATGDHPSTRMMRLGLTASSGPLRYGLRYRSAGPSFYNGSDQALKEVWGEWKEGVTTVSSAVGQQWNNVEGDPTRARVEQQYGRLGLSLNKPAWPNLALTYSQNASNTLDPIGVAPLQKNNQTAEAALGYAGSVWNARLASSYGLETDLLRTGFNNRVKTQTVTASFHPFDALTIAPTLGYRAEQQEWSGTRIDSPSLSLAMSYKQSQRLLVSALGNYSETRSSDRLIDLETLGGKGIVAWDLQQSRNWTTRLSVEGAYNRQLNQVTPSAQMEDLSGILRLSVAPF